MREGAGEEVADVVPYGVTKDQSGIVRWAARCPDCGHIVVGRAELLRLQCGKCGAELIITMPEDQHEAG